MYVFVVVVKVVERKYEIKRDALSTCGDLLIVLVTWRCDITVTRNKFMFCSV